jgi:small subunit ribosomal protein S14
MVRKAKIVRQQKLLAKLLRAKAEGRKMKHAIRVRNRCRLTFRPRGYMSDFGVSQAMFRELADKALIPGITKSSW